MKLSRKSDLFVVLILLLFIDVSGSCYAEAGNEQRTIDGRQGQYPAVPFDSLTESQKRVLEPMREQWATLPATKQRRLIRGSERWVSMSSEQRSRARAKMKRWRSMAPEKRRRMLKRLERYQAMSPEQRQRLRTTFRRFRQLPEEQRESLRERWRKSGAAERRQMRREMMRNNTSE